MRWFRWCRIVALGVLLLAPFAPRAARSQSSPYQGFGVGTVGGTGGTVVRVTNLNDSGPGSLRQALHHGNRIIVFDVAGEIVLTSHLYVEGPYVTIDGFSAPPPGITLRGHGPIIRGNRGVHDVIVRGIRVRDAAIDGIQIAYGAYNIVIDHVSVAGSLDGNIDITEGSHDVTVAWSIIGANKKSMLIKYNPARITLHHNVLVGSLERSPQVRIDDSETAVAADTTADIRNNLIANWSTGYGTIVWYGPRVNVVNNVYASAKHQSELRVTEARVFVAGNVSTGETSLSRLGTEASAFAAPAVDTQDACTAAKQALASAGVRPLDAVDQQLLSGITLPACPSTTPVLAANPERLTFQATELGEKPSDQTLMISSHGPNGVSWTATIAVAGGGSWLAATPTKGTTPARLTLTASVAGLTAGTYSATVTIAVEGSGATALSIPVELAVAAAPAGEAQKPGSR
jgi:hypothetical protein